MQLETKAPVYFQLLMRVANWKKMTPLAWEPVLCEHHMGEAHGPFSPTHVHVRGHVLPHMCMCEGTFST